MTEERFLRQVALQRVSQLFRAVITTLTVVPIRQSSICGTQAECHQKKNTWIYKGFSKEFHRSNLNFEMFTAAAISMWTVFQEEGSCWMSRQVEASVVPCLACSTCHCRSSSSSKRFPFTGFSTAIICHRSPGKEKEKHNYRTEETTTQHLRC